MRLLGTYRRGPIPAETGRDALTAWADVEPDPDDGERDGDDSVHHDAHAAYHGGRQPFQGRDE